MKRLDSLSTTGPRYTRKSNCSASVHSIVSYMHMFVFGILPVTVPEYFGALLLYYQYSQVQSFWCLWNGFRFAQLWQVLCNTYLLHDVSSWLHLMLFTLCCCLAWPRLLILWFRFPLAIQDLFGGWSGIHTLLGSCQSVNVQHCGFMLEFLASKNALQQRSIFGVGSRTAASFSLRLLLYPILGYWHRLHHTQLA